MKVKLRLDALELRDVPSAVVDTPTPVNPPAAPAQSPADVVPVYLSAWLSDFYNH